MDFSKILKANPYHGEGGRFTGPDSATFVSTGEKFGKFLTRVQGTFHGPNRGAGYSGKVAAGIAKVLGERRNPDHKLVTGMKSHVVDTNAKTREEFNRKRSDIHQVLTMNGFKQTGKEYADRGVLERTTYDHPNGAAAVVEHDVQSAVGASKWIGTEIFHGQKAKKADDEFMARVLLQLQSIAGPTLAQVLKGAPMGNHNAAGPHDGSGGQSEALPQHITHTPEGKLRSAADIPKLEAKIKAKNDALGMARESRKMKGQRQQGQREVSLGSEIYRLGQELHFTKRLVESQTKKTDFAQVLKGMSNPEVEVLDPKKKKLTPTPTTTPAPDKLVQGDSEVTVAGAPCSQGSY